jgi:hypothetical protein
MPKHVCLLAAALMLVSGIATAHSWYPKECCHDQDCRPVPCSEIHQHLEKIGPWKLFPFSLRWQGMEFYGPQIRKSLDDECHVCTRPDESLGGPVCIFIPDTTS